MRSRLASRSSTASRSSLGIRRTNRFGSARAASTLDTRRACAASGARLSTCSTSQSRRPKSGHSTIATPPASRSTALSIDWTALRMRASRVERRLGEGVYVEDASAIAQALEEDAVCHQADLASELELAAVGPRRAA